MNKKIKRDKIDYAWYIVFAGFIIMATAWPIVFNSASLFINPISEDLNLTRTQISLTTTIRAIFQMAISLISGRIFKRFNVKRIMQIATLSLFVSFFATSYISSLLMLYILTAISAVSAVLMATLPLSIIINDWFYKNKGLAVGIAFAGSGIGAMILSSMIGKWIINYGWRTTYQILATIMLVLSFPVISLIIYNKPSDLGLKPYGKLDFNVESNVSDKNLITGGTIVAEKEGVMFSDVMKSMNFWGILLCTILISMGVSAMVASISPHLTDMGYSTVFSANIVGISMGGLAVGKLVLGRTYDSLGVLAGTTLAYIATIVGLFGLIFAGSYLGLFAIVFGVGVGPAYPTIANPIITSELFGSKDYGTIHGILQAAQNLGGAISPALIGILYDLKGNYILSYKILIIFTVIAMIIFPFVLRNYKEVEESVY